MSGERRQERRERECERDLAMTMMSTSMVGGNGMCHSPTLIRPTNFVFGRACAKAHLIDKLLAPSRFILFILFLLFLLFLLSSSLHLLLHPPSSPPPHSCHRLHCPLCPPTGVALSERCTVEDNLSSLPSLFLADPHPLHSSSTLPITGGSEGDDTATDKTSPPPLPNSPPPPPTPPHPNPP